jgi:hypothetical protein
MPGSPLFFVVSYDVVLLVVVHVSVGGEDDVPKIDYFLRLDPGADLAGELQRERIGLPASDIWEPPFWEQLSIDLDEVVGGGSAFCSDGKLLDRFAPLDCRHSRPR